MRTRTPSALRTGEPLTASVSLAEIRSVSSASKTRAFGRARTHITISVSPAHLPNGTIMRGSAPVQGSARLATSAGVYCGGGSPAGLPLPGDCHQAGRALHWQLHQARPSLPRRTQPTRTNTLVGDSLLLRSPAHPSPMLDPFHEPKGPELLEPLLLACASSSTGAGAGVG